MFRSFFVFRSFANRFPFVRSFGSFVRSFVRACVRAFVCIIRSFASIVRSFVWFVRSFTEKNERLPESFTEITERFRTIPNARLCNYSILRQHTNELTNALIVYGNSRTIARTLMFTNIDEE